MKYEQFRGRIKSVEDTGTEIRIRFVTSGLRLEYTWTVADVLRVRVAEAFNALELINVWIDRDAARVERIEGVSEQQAIDETERTGTLADLLRHAFGVDTTIEEIARVMAQHHAERAQAKWNMALRYMRNDAECGGWGGYAPDLGQITWLRGVLDEIECSRSYEARALKIADAPAEGR